MSTAALSDTDIRVRDAVLRQLEWDPRVDASAIGVTAKGGAVTLTGYIDSYSGKLQAERAAKHIRGVRAVANDIEVRLKLERTDADIAGDVAHAMALRSTIPETVQATVHDGHVTLTGSANWLFQSQDAERVVHHIRGIRGVKNYITVAPQALVKDVRHRIVAALHRNANVDAQHIVVAVTGDTAVLSGTVSTWLQRDAVEDAAAEAPGVTRVDNRVVVEPRDAPADELC